MLKSADFHNLLITMNPCCSNNTFRDIIKCNNFRYIIEEFMVFNTTARSRNSILPYICMAKEHANVGMECLAMKSAHCILCATKVPPAYKNWNDKLTNHRVMQYISRSTETSRVKIFRRGAGHDSEFLDLYYVFQQSTCLPV